MKEFENEKHIKTSTTMVLLDDYKYQLNHDAFLEVIKALLYEGIILLNYPKNDIHKIELHFNFKKIVEVVNIYDGYEIDKELYENFEFQECVILYVALKLSLEAGRRKLEMRYSQIISYFFIIGFFFNFELLYSTNGPYKLKMNKEIRIILNGLDKIQKVDKRTFEVVLLAEINKENAVVYFSSLYSEVIQALEKYYIQ